MLCRHCGTNIEDAYDPLYKGDDGNKVYYGFCSEKCAEEYMEIETGSGFFLVDEMDYQDIMEWEEEIEESMYGGEGEE